ncbi:MAG: hypothetical protein ACFFDN_41245, partial [Candidatus Hodarchaeota archaeon]
GTINKISADLSNSLKDMEQKLSEVKIDVLKTVQELKSAQDVEEGVPIQPDILNKTSEQLELFEKSLQEFWDLTKKLPSQISKPNDK